MKNLWILSLFFVCGSSAFGSVVRFTTQETEVFPSENIVISVTVDSGYQALTLTLDRIVSSNGGAASGLLSLNPSLTLFTSTGTIVNNSGVLIQGVDGCVGGLGVFATGDLYSFTYHVPMVPFASYITISAPMNADYFAAAVVQGLGEVIPDSLTIIVLPEPMMMALLAVGGLVALRRRHA